MEPTTFDDDMSYIADGCGDISVSTEAIITGDRSTVVRLCVHISNEGRTKMGFVTRPDGTVVRTHVPVPNETFYVTGEALRHGDDRPNLDIAQKLAFGRAMERATARLLRQAEGLIAHADWVRADRARPERKTQKAAHAAALTAPARTAEAVAKKVAARTAAAPARKAVAKKRAATATPAQRSEIAKRAAATRAAKAKKASA